MSNEFLFIICSKCTQVVFAFYGLYMAVYFLKSVYALSSLCVFLFLFLFFLTARLFYFVSFFVSVSVVLRIR